MARDRDISRRRFLSGSGIALTGALLAGSEKARAQGKPNLSGSWVYAEEKSKMPEGFSVTLSFPSELVIKQSATDIQMTGTSNHLQPIVSHFKLDGSEASFDTAAGRVKAKASWDGNKLVIAGTRTYGSPVGDIVVTTKDVYSLNGNVLTVERTQQTAGASQGSGITVYTKAPS